MALISKRNHSLPGGAKVRHLLGLALCLGLGTSCDYAFMLFGNQIPPFTMYWAVAAGDMNGDGKMDLVFTHDYVNGPPPHPACVSVLLQDPAKPGTFLPPVAYPTGAEPTSLKLADIDGDGRLDVIVGNSSEHRVSVYLQDPALPGRLLAPTLLSAGTYVNDVAISDLNGDGKPDIAVAGGDGLVLFYQDPALAGSFLPAVLIPGGGGSGHIAVGDLDSDSHPDIVVTTAKWVVVFLQDPSTPGTFSSFAYFAGTQPAGAVIQDLNGDGKPDLAVANQGSPSGGSQASLSVLLQDPAQPGRFQGAIPYPTGLGSFSIASADLDGDGHIDLVVGDDAPNQAGYSLSLFLQNPAVPGDYGTARTLGIPLQGGAWSLAAADLNGDGRLDLIVGGGTMGVLALFQDPANPGQFYPPVVVGKWDGPPAP